MKNDKRESALTFLSEPLQRHDVSAIADLKTWRLPTSKPYYETRLGAAYLGDALELIRQVENESTDLVCTSPPFALKRKKEYGNVPPEEYVEWFRPFSNEFWRVLKPSGSLVIHLGGSWNAGIPTKTLYQFKLLIDLVERQEYKFHLAQDFYWYNAGKLPSPAEWVNVQRIRAKDAVDFLWWMSKSERPRADNAKVLKEYSESMLNLLRNGYQAKLRPSGHDISEKFSRKHAGSIHPNFLVYSNTDSNSRYLRMCRDNEVKIHPARWPDRIPQFFIQFLTNRGDKVLDPFGGSNMTGAVAESLGRRWMCFEISEEYLNGSKFRFENDQLLSRK